MINGFAINRIARPRDHHTEATALFQTLRALFIIQIMDDDELTSWDHRLRQPPPHTPPTDP